MGQIIARLANILGGLKVRPGFWLPRAHCTPYLSCCVCLQQYRTTVVVPAVEQALAPWYVMRPFPLLLYV